MSVSCFRYLVVDDDTQFRERLCLALSERGNEVIGAGSVSEARSQLDSFQPERIILDLKMPGESGLELIEEVAKRSIEADIVVLTGFGSIATAVDAMRRGAKNYLTKPVTVSQLLNAFNAAEAATPSSSPVLTSVPSLEDVEWEHIQRVYQECNQNVSLTAKTLGLHRRSLQRKLARGA